MRSGASEITQRKKKRVFSYLKFSQMKKVKCTGCGIEKEQTEENFHKDVRQGKEGFVKKCKDCIHARQKAKSEEKKQFAFF